MATQRILVIEDEENIRDTIQVALEADGYVVETAADGAEGLRRFAEPSGWDLILVDQRMPGVQGLEVVQRIRQTDHRTPVLLITAYGTVELAGDVLKAGASGFLRKPFTPAELREVVAQRLRPRDSER